METNPNEGMYLVIPTIIARRDDISRSAVILYGYLGALSNSTGYCFATNAFLSQLMATTDPTLRRCMKELKDAGLIRVELIMKDNGELQERRITLKSHLIDLPPEGIEEKPSKNYAYGSQKNVFLNADNYQSLKAMYPDLDETIEDMSLYLAKNNKRYKNCYAALLQWYRKRAKEQPKKGSKWDGIDY